MDEKTESSYLYKKIDSIEHRLESHVTKIEQRLDQLVHIMSAVAALQERESRNADGIKEVKSTLKESFETFQKALERIHKRLDELHDEQEKEIDACVVRDKELNIKVSNVQTEVAKWRDRGVGLWLGLSLLVFVIQGYGGMVLSSYMEEYKATKIAIVEISKKQLETSQEVERLVAKLSANQDKGSR
jgi:Na+-transporting methylmalonyl-CoA/oxaloacetate decarboxylase gamma subunit